ncbi:hypothetical protein V1527DRAFT_518760 [Lipomyces starkeyi]
MSPVARGCTDSSDPTESAIRTSSSTQMKELRDYISWYTRDHITHTEPKLSVLTSSIRPDSSYNFDASTVSCHKCKVLELRSLLGTEIGALVEGQSGMAYVATKSNGVMTLLSLTAPANPRVDLTVQCYCEAALWSGTTAFALVDKVVSIERLLILKFNPRAVGFLAEEGSGYAAVRWA